MKATAKIKKVLIRNNEMSAKRFAKQEEAFQQYREIANKPACVETVLIVVLMAKFNHSQVNIA